MFHVSDYFNNSKALIYLALCQKATLAHLESLKKTSKSEISRQKEILEFALKACAIHSRVNDIMDSTISQDIYPFLNSWRRKLLDSGKRCKTIIENEETGKQINFDRLYVVDVPSSEDITGAEKSIVKRPLKDLV